MVLRGDYVVPPRDAVMPCPFSVEGDVIVKSGSTLTMRGCDHPGDPVDFHMIQSPGSDHDIIVESGATLVISGATIEGDDALDIQGNGSAEVVISDSKVDLKGGEVKGRFTSIDVSGSEIDAGAWTAPAFVTVKESRLSLKTIVLNFRSEFDTVDITGEVLVEAERTDLIDVRPQGVNVSGAGEAWFYRYVDLTIFDGLSVPVATDGIKAINIDNASHDTGGSTGQDGRGRLKLVHDILTVPRIGNTYEGNWRIEITMPGVSKPLFQGVALPHYQHANQPRSISRSVAFSEVQVPGKTIQDMFIEQTYTLAGGGQEQPHRWRGNIHVETGNTLTLGPGLFLEFPAGALGRSIIVKSGATLVLAGAEISGCLAIYAEAGARVVGSGLISDCGLGSLGGTFDARDATFRGAMSGEFDSVKAEGLWVLGPANLSAVKEVSLRDSIFRDDLMVRAPTIAIRTISVSGEFTLPGRTGELSVYSLTCLSLKIDDTLTLKRYWNLDITVINGGGRLVPNALVTYLPLNKSGSATDSNHSGLEGTVSFDLLGDTTAGGVTGPSNVYNYDASFVGRDGTYHTDNDSVVLNQDYSRTLMFIETIIPPETILATIEIGRPEYLQGEQILIQGTVTLEDGSLANNATVNLTVLQLGPQVGSYTTGPDGRYSFSFTAPQTEGSYTVQVDVYDPVQKLRGQNTGTFIVKKSDAVPWTITLIAIIVIGSIVGLYSMSRYRKWQEFRRDARENPLFKEEKMFDEVERQLRTELAKEMGRGRIASPPGATVGQADDENGRGKRKRGGLLGTDGGVHLATLAARMKQDGRGSRGTGPGRSGEPETASRRP